MAENDVQEQRDAQDNEQHEDVLTEEQQAEAAAEERALKIGWRPQSDWKGDPDLWKPASEWLEKGDTILGTQLREAQATIEELRTAQETGGAEFEKRVDRLEKMYAKREEKMREQLESDFEERIRKAVETGDSDAVEKAFKDRKASDKERAKEAEKPADEKADLSSAQKTWLEDNKSWYGKDKAMTGYANGVADEVEAAMPAATEAEKLVEIAKRVREQFPDKFGNGKKPSPVEGGQRVFNGGDNPKGKLFSKLPPEARTRFNQDVKSGLYKKDQGEEWAEAYYS